MKLDHVEVARWIEDNTRAYSPSAGIQQFALNRYQLDFLAEICRFDSLIKTKDRQVGCTTVLTAFSLYVSAVHKEYIAYYTPNPSEVKRRMWERNRHLSQNILDKVLFCRSPNDLCGYEIATIISDDHDIFNSSLSSSVAETRGTMVLSRNGSGKSIVTITAMPEMIKGKYAQDMYGALE